MIVLFVSECEKAAWKRTRRTLSHYAVQIGRRTWLARMSHEGLQDIRKELTRHASRHTAVACHRVRGKYRTELAWVVGTKRHFSQTGEFAFSHTERPVIRHLEEKTPFQRLLHYTVHLAGLFHDLGKQIELFQTKLRERSANKSDPIRHERISAVIVLAMIHELYFHGKDNRPAKSAPKKFRSPRTRHRAHRVSPKEDRPATFTVGDDKEWICLLMDSTAIEKALNRVRDKGLSHYNHLVPRHFKDSPDVIKPDWFSMAGKNELPVILTGIIYLIIAHHKMPGGRENYFPEENRYLNRPQEMDEGLKLCQKYPLVWEAGKRWQTKTSEIASRLDKLLRNNRNPATDNPATWFTAIQYIARPALVFADHLISRESTRTETNIAGINNKNKELCYANTRGNNILAHPLEDHLLQVGRKSGRILHLLLEMQQNLNTPVVEKAPTRLINNKINKESPFFWQKKAEERIKKIKNLETSGFFGVIMAETGSGKTRANAQILSALSRHENLRFTVALGLRTLTLQTGDEYLEELGFSEDQASVMVGSALSRFLHDTRKAEDAPKGAESMDLNDEYYEGLPHIFQYDPDSSWPEEFIVREKPKLSQLFRTPVLICTVDHLIPAVEKHNASASLLNVRLINSDLIIDEIDSFQSEDLIALLKLCYLTGFHGRRLLVSSATVPPATVRALYRAYSEGYQRYRNATGTSNPIYAGWFTHLPDCQQIRKVDSAVTFNRLHKKFAGEFAKRINQAPPRRRVKIVGITHEIKSGTVNGIYEKVLHQCREFHTHHRGTDDKTGIRYSIGAVRWNNVLHTRGFVHHWLNKDVTSNDSTVIRFAAYHAKHLPLILHEMETHLSELLTRKTDTHAPCNNPIMRRHLDKAAEKGMKDLIIIVSTSPISEVGRDHDYDWAILEPCSYWSLIQMAGRIWRHRFSNRAKTPNIGLLSTSMKALQKKRGGKTFFHPGPETASHRLNVTDFARVEKVFDIDQLKESVTANFTLMEPESINSKRVNGHELYESMTDLEHGRLRYLLESPHRRHSLQDFLSGDRCGIYFTSRHAEENLFRKGMKGKPIWYEQEPVENWCTLDNSGKFNINRRITEDKITFPDQSFFPPDKINRHTLMESWKDRLNQNNLENPMITMGFEPELYPGQDQFLSDFLYHDLLGWIIKPNDF